MVDESLLDGYRRFRAGPYLEQRARYDRLAGGQAPRAMVVACSDSRVDPATIFDAGPGDLFVVRNVANLVPPYERGGGRHGVSAAIEFAVLGLGVAQIIVLGHGNCGGIAAALDGHDLAPPDESFVSRWMNIITPTRDMVRRAAALSRDMDTQRALELAAIRVSLDNLRQFPFVTAREATGHLSLTGAHFSIADGLLRVLTGDSFEVVSER